MGDSHKMLVTTNIKVFDIYGNIKNNFNISPSDTHDWMIGLKTDDVYYEQTMRSFNINFPYVFFRILYSGNNDTAWTVNGSKVTGNVTLTAPVGNAGNIDGICLGTGSLTSSFYIYNLDYEIPNTILTRGGTTWVKPYVSGSTYEFALYRPFTATQNFTITEMKLCGNTTNRYMWTYEKIDVSGSAINISLPSGSTATAWLRFNIAEGGPLTKNYLYHFYSILRNTTVTLTSTTSASSEVNFYTYANSYINNGSTEIYGIVVGTDTSSFSIEDYKLYDRIPNGTGSGQLNYLSIGFLNSYTNALPAPDSHSFSETIYRQFINLSGGPVNIGECAIYLRGSSTETEDNKKIMIARTALPEYIILQHREAIQISYNLEFTA